MSLTGESLLFAPAENEDPAVPGDPWTRLRFLYGQLLGAQDFTAEQRSHVLRHRLHLALLHGAGTVWGLRVFDGPAAEPEPRPEIVVAEGLAVDALGREIYVDQEQCLDISNLHDNPIWNEMQNLDRPGETREGREAYVVLSYLACLSDRVPAIEPPCSHADELAPFGRVNDRFRIDLLAAPPDPELLDLQRPWLDALTPRTNDGGWRSPREALLDHIMNTRRTDLPALSAYWLQTIEAPLVLARVELVLDQSGGVRRTGVLAVDNSPRAILPSSQLVAEQVFGQRLVGRDRRRPLCLTSIKATGDLQAKLDLEFSHDLPALNASARKQVASLQSFEGSGWKNILASSQITDNVLTLNAEPGALSVGSIYHLHVNGSGPSPLIGAAGEALAGWWSDGVPPMGGGRDISIVTQWQPST